MQFKTTYLIVLLFVFSSISAQDTTQTNILKWAEVMPKFPGGDKALIQYLATNIFYPVEARLKEIQGKVIVGFYIDKEGNVKGSNIVKSLGGGCDEEALRVVNSLPKWIPGMHNGEPVNVSYHFPVTFKIEYREEDSETSTYPGGTNALLKFLADNLQYPNEAREAGKQGVVKVQFYIDIDGSIQDLKVISDQVGSGCAEEALRIIRLMPNWIPGTKNGNPIKVPYTVPITFKLDDNTKIKDNTKIEVNYENETIQTTLPQFPGGNIKLMKFLGKELFYPEEARNKGLEGKVIISFDVDIDGTILNPKIIKDAIGAGCGEEALRVVNLMPKWIPGTKNGTPTKSSYTLPINFK
ncbi:MAG: energy transducer TonB [Chitinophagales bacterium]